MFVHACAKMMITIADKVLNYHVTVLQTTMHVQACPNYMDMCNKHESKV